MLKEMCWLPTRNSQGTKILHLRTDLRAGWRPYNCFSEYAVPDYPVPGGSKGYATYQKLRNQNWELIPSPQAERYSWIDTDQQAS